MGEVYHWSTDRLDEAARFDAWAEVVRSQHLDWDLSTSVNEPYSAEIRYRRAGDIHIAEGRCSNFRGSRDPSADTGDVVGIEMTLGGEMACAYGDAEFIAVPEDLFVWGSDLARAFDSRDPRRMLSLLVPRSRVPRSLAAWIASSRAVTTRAGTGMLSIAADQLRAITREMENLSESALAVSVDSLLDTLAAAVAPSQGIPSGQRAALLAEIQFYIQQHLDDSRLCATSIAAAHRISVRTLHLVFAEGGMSVGRWTRQQRLERCHRELSRAGGSTTVTDVAFRWGFSDAAHFSRAFKQAYGVSPSDVLRR
jgi:AraC-like DNA-binding protein